ncbi:hypothetical protein [Fodinicola acaciae]|uniref:hypothetical protein n=1 Tax=Fodinicola acaciae TaxID=2681555 RepID=UPI0013D14EAA|nr:hypothetical protein [Fodinicola acaciae]
MHNAIVRVAAAAAAIFATAALGVALAAPVNASVPVGTINGDGVPSWTQGSGGTINGDETPGHG